MLTEKELIERAELARKLAKQAKLPLTEEEFKQLLERKKREQDEKKRFEKVYA